MIEIPLSRGNVAIIDDEDLELVSRYKWHAVTPPSAQTPYATTHVPGDHDKAILLHRLILGVPPDVHVDHRDGDGLNCRRYNLRAATRAQNAANRRRNRKSVSGFKGVTFHKGVRKWRVRIRKDGKLFHLGFFTKAEDGARRYDEEAVRLFGEWARLNFPAELH